MSSDYSARHLSVLEGLEAVRKRPGMYIGSTDSRGLMHCLWEIIDNSVDEALAGHGSEIGVVLHPDGSVEVSDKARGIPVDVEPKTGLSGVEVVFTKLHAGGKFGSGSYAASGGLHGVGASVVNALSERLDVEVDRDGKTWAMSFHRGEPGVFADTGQPTPDAPFTPFEEKSELRVVGKVAKGVTGTRIRYWADTQIFSRGAAFQTDDLVGRARQTAFLVPGLALSITDERGDEPVTESFRYDGGISEFADFLAPDAGVTDVWRIQGTGTFTETVPVLQPNGHMVPTELERECVVDLALRFSLGEEAPDDVALPRFSQPAAIHYLISAPGRLPTGRVRRVGALGPILSAEGVVDAVTYLEPGTLIRPVRDAEDRHGYVLATGPTSLDALANADYAAGLVVVEVE